MSPTAQQPGENPSEFVQAAREAKENNNVNCECRFSPDAEKNCDMLGKAAYPNNPEKQEYYKAKIMASMEAWLAKGVSMQDLWSYCANQYCQTTAIIEGILKFFAGEKGEKEINISKFLKPVEYVGTSTTQEVNETFKKNILAQTRNDLSALLAEIKSAQA